MKKPLAVFLLAALTLTVLAGCQSVNAAKATPIGVSATNLDAQITLETPTPATTPAVTILTAQQAETVALTHADINPEDALMERTELERERDVLYYDIEFRVGDYEYDYAIEAITGQVLRWKREYDPKKTAPTVPMVTEPPVTEPPVTESTVPPTVPENTAMITVEKAKAIALAHAGLTAGEVRFDRTELDREYGALVYEVEFRAGKWEYSYEIHAETGKILEWEKDVD